jgi:hypothetical protein
MCVGGVCMYVCGLYVFGVYSMYICVWGFMDVCGDVCMSVGMYEHMCVGKYVCVWGCMYVCVWVVCAFVCRGVCINVGMYV